MAKRTGIQTSPEVIPCYFKFAQFLAVVERRLSCNIKKKLFHRLKQVLKIDH